LFDRFEGQGGAPPRVDRGGSFSIIAQDVTIAGNISAGNDVQINGQVEGNVECLHLSIGETGKVRARSRPRRSSSRARRRAIAAAKVELLATAQLSGDISYQDLMIELGAKISGKLNYVQDRGLKLVTSEAKAEK